MILYHGSNIEVREPRLLKIQRELDFGRGFYTTSDYDQAKSWALRSARIRGEGNPLISVYEMPQRLKDQYTFKTERAISMLGCREVVSV